MMMVVWDSPVAVAVDDINLLLKILTFVLPSVFLSTYACKPKHGALR